MGSVMVVAVGRWEGRMRRRSRISSRLGALYAPVEVGSLGRQDDEFEPVAAMVLEDGHQLGTAVDVDSPDLEGRAHEQLVKQVRSGLDGWGAGDVADRPFGDRIVSTKRLM